MRFAIFVGIAAYAAFSAVPAVADDPTIVFTNATIYTGTTEKPLEKATLIVRSGKIVAVGADKIPDGATVTDLKGAVIIPGLVDTHSHIGLYAKPNVSAHSDGNEMSGPVQGIVRAGDSVWPGDPGIRMARAGGVTTANIMPGSGNVIGGQTLYCKLRGDTVEAMQVTGKLPDGTVILGGLKMANGENPKGYGRNKSQAPFTRMKVAALQRSEFVKAKEYQRKWQEYHAKKKKGEEATEPARDLALEPLVEVLERKRTVHFHCHRADDLMTAIRLSEEFGFELVLQHATEGYRIASIIAKKKIPVSLTLIDSPGGKAECVGLLDENAAVLDKAGVPVTINTDDSVTESRFLLRTGAIAVRGGLSEAKALHALTLGAARVLHLDHRVGSLEPGKDADFVILSGQPFSVYTKVRETWIDGQKRFDAADALQRPYRDGGFALPPGTVLPAVPVIAPPKEFDTGGDPGTRMATSPDKSTIIYANRIHVGDGTVLTDSAILITNGKITKIMPFAKASFPKTANRITTADVTPGLIDTFCTAGLSGAWNIPADQDQDEISDASQTDLRVFDGFNPHESLLEFLRMNGVTVTHTTPGRRVILGGTSGVFRLKEATVEKAALHPTFALLVNLGEVPKGQSGPKTRMGVAGLVRKTFVEAQAHAAKPAKDRTPNPKLDALLPALEGKTPVIFAAHRADDIRTALRLADEFQLQPIIALGTEAYLLADELAKRKVPVIVHPTMQRAGGSMETLNTLLANAAILKQKGVPVTICTGFEGYVPKSRNLRAEAALAAANGLGHAAALQAVTLDAAKLLGIDKTHGSIAVGKTADLVLYDGDPFEHTTHVTQTIIDGRVVYDRTEYLALPFERRVLPLLGGGEGLGCCLGW